MSIVTKYESKTYFIKPHAKNNKFRVHI